MTLDDLKRLFTRQTLFRLDSILSPRLVPIFYALGLAGILLWAVSHFFWSFGFGFGNGPSTRLGYVPAQQTDFIFTVAGEEFGFIGAGTLVLLFAIMIWRIWRIAQLAADPMGTLVCVGVMSMLLFHIFENIGMNLGIMPITGIPLPFVSQGGSSVIASFVAIGLVQSVHMHRFA